ncbi:MAG: hypothetical protein GC146_07610 [Limimaricola sp.]|uniref:hypothetical protein n=1 Tax=Limimaricola sp. TaxID=2211665 RepID=UPI001D4247B2|nr:hypothetical protein [Limimaricola sp.]MBI1417070.1 hypothetical protein [Limimaricola sp.]
MRQLTFAACVLATAAAADEAPLTLTSDLNRDSAYETFLLTPGEDGTYDLRIDTARGQEIVAPGFVWAGAMAGQMPGLALAANGSVQVISMNDSVGRDRWRQVLTIVYRKGAYQVAGFTYGWHDTLDAANYGDCDVNLLTGRGEATHAGVIRTFRTRAHAVPVTRWADDPQVPPECGIAP